jgi:hypothetical protein
LDRRPEEEEEEEERREAGGAKGSECNEGGNMERFAKAGNNGLSGIASTKNMRMMIDCGAYIIILLSLLLLLISSVAACGT